MSNLAISPSSGVTERLDDLSDLVIDYLDELGIEFVFGIPGGAIEPIYNALARSQREGRVRPVVARHEAGAAFMADGYARETGKLGVCCATTGPGTTNLLTGVASAYADNIPLLVITAQTALPSFGRGAFQESSYDAIDTVEMFETCTRYSTVVTHPHQLESKLATAITLALREPRGPVHLSFPMDILRHPAQEYRAYPNLEHLLTNPLSAPVDNRTLRQLYHEIIEQNKRVVLLLGSGCREAMPAILRFAEFVYAPILTTPQGKSWLNPRHPLYRGVFGFAGHESARRALIELKEYDEYHKSAEDSGSTTLILAVGTSLGEWSTDSWDKDILMNNRLVHIDSSMERFARSPMAHLQIYGRLKSIFETLYDWANEEQMAGMHCPWTAWTNADAPRVSSQEVQEHDQEANYYAPPTIQLMDRDKYLLSSTDTVIKPQRLMYELNRKLPPQARILADTGNSFAWTTHYLLHKTPGTYRLAMGFGSMGWAIGAAVGTAMAKPDVPVICITGDGSMLMNGQELTVAVAEHLKVMFIVLNDRSLGMVKHGQRLTGAERIAYELPAVDFAMMAKAQGAEGYTIKCLDDLEKLDCNVMCRMSGPVLLDVHIDPEEVPPMGMRARALKSA